MGCRGQRSSSVYSPRRGRLPLLYALCVARFGAGARYDPKEEQRTLCRGSHKRPGSIARLLLQLDDLDDGLCGWSPRATGGLAATWSHASRLIVNFITPHRIEQAGEPPCQCHDRDVLPAARGNGLSPRAKR